MNLLVKIPSNFRGTYPRVGKAFVLGSGVMFLLSGYSYYQSFAAERQVQWRKQQLSLPVYKLSEEQHISPPWNKDNINEWLYRRVEVTGKIVHRNACLLPTEQNGSEGFEYVVPLLVKEQAERANPQGLIVSKGFIPFSVKDPGTRYRIENTQRRSFIGFVSQLPQFDHSQIFGGNSTIEGKFNFSSADIEDFVKTAEFVNRKEASVAIVEELRETGKLNERDHWRRDLDCAGTQNYPYAKTESGALQLPKMPWTYRNDSSCYFWGGLLSFVLGASIF